MKICTKCKIQQPLTNFYTSESKRKNARCKSCLCLYNKIYRINHPDYVNKFNNINKERSKQRRYDNKINVFNHYTNNNIRCQCSGCSESLIEFLTIDHISGDGKQHRKIIGSHIHDWLIKQNFPLGFRVLCMNCNHSFGIYGYCPHSNSQPKNAQETV